MKEVYCKTNIDNLGYTINLTTKKRYKVYSCDIIIDDMNELCYYKSCYFMNIAEVRNEKIDKLLEQ
jgi:hypothetical protein